jgi:hypothetical protein
MRRGMQIQIHRMKLDMKMQHGRTALMLAALINATDIMRLLLEHGADPFINNEGTDLKTKVLYLEIKLEKKEKENKKLQDEVDLLYVSPLPGKEFIHLYRQEFTDSTIETFIDAYVPILKDNLTPLFQKQ